MNRAIAAVSDGIWSQAGLKLTAVSSSVNPLQWTGPEFLNTMTLSLTIPDMACSACADTITQAVKALDAAATIAANTDTKVVTIETQTPEAAVKAAIVAAGYNPA